MHREGRTSLGASGRHKMGPTADPEEGRGSVSTELSGWGRQGAPKQGVLTCPGAEAALLGSGQAAFTPSSRRCQHRHQPHSPSLPGQRHQMGRELCWRARLGIGCPCCSCPFSSQAAWKGAPRTPSGIPAAGGDEAHFQMLCVTTTNTPAQAWAGSRYAGRHACLC